MVAVAVIGLLAGYGYRSARQLDSPAGQLRITSGARNAVYNQFATALAAQVHRRDSRLRVDVQTSSGSLQNLQRLRDGTADCAVTAADAAALAVLGQSPFTQPAQFQALARVYDDYIQLVTVAGAHIGSISDLRGKRVSLGSAGSGVRLISGRLLDEANLPISSIKPMSLDINQSVAQLASGTIDAFFWSGGLPTAQIQKLLADPRYQLVPLGGVAVRMSANYNGAYRTATIPTGAYGISGTVETLAVANLVVCNTSVSAAVAELVVETLFGDQAAIVRSAPALNGMDERSAIATDPVPLHPGALRWFRQQKN
ncbi:TAXI family TRAP transporter solute-binding subunit [soil metagenome]